MPAVGVVDGGGVVVEPFEGVYVGGETEELEKGLVWVEVFGIGRVEYVKDWGEAVE